MAHKHGGTDNVRIRILDDGSYVYSVSSKTKDGELMGMRDKEYSAKSVDELISFIKNDFKSNKGKPKSNADKEYERLTKGKNG